MSQRKIFNQTILFAQKNSHLENRLNIWSNSIFKTYYWITHCTLFIFLALMVQAWKILQILEEDLQLLIKQKYRTKLFVEEPCLGQGSLVCNIACIA